jgi:4-hydroxybenzoate polyprenyltransferase
MVLNDVFDAEVDAQEQPTRPIPSGQVSLRAATVGGWSLWFGGIAVALVLSLIARDWRPVAVAGLLAACIVLYDRVLKRTFAAPVVMGACRTLNVLLGMSLAYLSKPTADGELLFARAWLPHEWLIAVGIGAYVMGVTLFASTDTTTSARGRLIAGLAVLVAGMALLAFVPALTNNQPRLVVIQNGWYLLWALLALITVRRCVAAIITPGSRQVQAAVRHCVHSIIVLNAAVCVGYVSPYWGFAVLALIFPVVALTAWLQAT